MAIITHVCVFTEKSASVFKQLLAERTTCFRYTPVNRGYTPLDDVDAVFHLKAKEPIGSIWGIKRHRRSNSGVYSNHGPATTRFHRFVYRDLEPEITVSVPLDGTFCFGDFINRWFFKEPYIANRFREYRKDTILEFDSFFNPEDVSVFPLMSQRLETDFELINVFVPQIAKRGFKVFNGFKHRLLPNQLRRRCQPLLIFKEIVIFSSHEGVAKLKLIVFVCFVVDSCHTRVISEPRSSRKLIQHQFLGFRRVDFDFPHPHHPL